nr:G protein-coupled receptor [Proales similis]
MDLVATAASFEGFYGSNYLSDLDEKDYMLRDENFCLFYQLHARGLNVKFKKSGLEEKASKSCDCMLFWMLENLYERSESFEYGDPNDIEDECSRRRNEMQKTCNFSQMATNCEFDEIKPYGDPPIYSMVLSTKYVEYLFSVIFGPVINVLAFVANLLVILTFRSIKRSPQYRKGKLADKNRRMWDYVILNSVFNLILSILFAFGPITSCIEYNGVYCTPFYFTRFSQYYYLFVESYLSNAMRLMSNVTNCMFVLYRYGANLEKLERLRKWKPKRVLGITLIGCLIISLIKLWVNGRLTLNALEEGIYYRLVGSNTAPFEASWFLKLINFLNMLLVNVIPNLINISIDWRLLLFLRQRSKKKCRKEAAESKITKIIILNGIFTFIFRSPEILTSIGMVMYELNNETFKSCLLSFDSLHSMCTIMFNISTT